MPQNRYAPRGALALPRSAYGALFDAPEKADAFVMRDGVAVVSICGPLMHHGSPWFDSYEHISERLGAAFAAKPRAVVMAIDSPGGLVSGLFESAREIREMADAAGVPLVAYVEGYATSAAYALACAADRIVMPATSVVGSIGVIVGRLDVSRANEARGVRVEVIASGERKADGCPDVPVSDPEIAATRAMVDELAGIFFAWVAERRPALSVDSVRGLEAGLALGTAAVSAGLADEVATLDQLIASASVTRRIPTMTTARAHRASAKTKGPHAMDPNEIRKLLDLPEDASDEDVMNKLREKLAPKEPEPDPDAEKAKQEAAALSKKLAASAVATDALRAQVEKLQATVAALEPLAAAQAKREREDKIDGAMQARGMKGHASRDRFVALAEQHGLDAALASIEAAHVPPSGSPIPAGASAKRSKTAPEADAVKAASQPTAEQRAAAKKLATELRAQFPNEQGHVLYARALKQVCAAS